MKHEPDASAEVEAVRRTLNGDTSAFEQLVKSHISDVRSVCLKYAHNSTEADDIAQEVFLRAYRSLSTFRTSRSFGAWIRGIALNQVKTHYAMVARRRDREAPYEYESADASLRGPADELAERSDREAILAAVGTLKSSVKEVVQRYYFEEQSVDEIAEALELSRENVKSRLHRGRKTLRQILVDTATGT